MKVLVRSIITFALMNSQVKQEPRWLQFVYWGVIALAGLFTILMVTRQMNVWNIYTQRSMSMYPTLNDSTKVWMNSWSKIERYDLIAFQNALDGGVEIQRVVGMPGDTLNIVNGILYVNGQPSLVEMEVTREYVIQPQDWKTTTQQLLLKTDKRMVRHEQYAGIIGSKAFLTQPDADYIAIGAKVTVFPGFEKKLYQPTNRQWTMSDYGPLTVPDNSYFTLCDARGHSRDSRFDGPVPFKSVLGKVSPL